MSTENHLKRIVNKLRNKFDDEIKDNLYWSWNCKNWTIEFTTDDDYESVVAYHVIDNSTNWDDWITLEKRVKEWKEII